MSPARRLVLACAAVVVVVVAAFAVLAQGLDREPAARPVAAVPQDRPGTVLLVPGYGGSTDALLELQARLAAAGRTAQLVRLPGGGTGDLRTYVPVLQQAAQAAVAAGAPSVDVVGYSAGGVVARLWTAGDGAGLARRVVTLGSPHHGTDVASFALQFAAGACQQACRQLVPGSDLLEQLNDGDETPGGPQWLSVWSAADQVVTPPDSARLEGATNVELQDVCAGARTPHGALPRDPQVQGLVLQALGAGPVREPDGCPAA